jgi:hypothetical protein
VPVAAKHYNLHVYAGGGTLVMLFDNAESNISVHNVNKYRQGGIHCDDSYLIVIKMY